MAKVAGLFTRQALLEVSNNATRRGKAGRAVSDETLQQMGPDGVKYMNPAARNPAMPAAGSKRPLVYVLGDVPTSEEDKAGEPFAGKGGDYLRRLIPDRLRSAVRYNNVIGTHPPKGRAPLREEIECFRLSVVADIERAKPAAILGTGQLPLAWMLGSGQGVQIRVARGRRFPVRVGQHECWFYPVADLTHVMRGGSQDRMGRQLRWLFERDVRRVFKECEDTPAPYVATERDVDEGVEIIEPGPKAVRLVEAALRDMRDCSSVAIDIEANRLRPHYKDFRFLSIAVGTFKRTVTFAVQHAEAKTSKEDRVRIWDALYALFKSGVKVVAHNLPYELECFAHKLGREVLAFNWHCTQAQAYVLDEREGGHSLDFLCKLNFGLSLKAAGDFDDRRRKAEMESVALSRILPYNGRDTKWTHKLFVRQGKELTRLGQDGTYELQRARVLPLTSMGLEGLPVSQKRIRKIRDTNEERLHKVEAKLIDSPEVQEYRARFGRPNFDSDDDLVRLYRDIKKADEGWREEDGVKSYSVDKHTLAAVGDDFSKLLTEYRGIHKLLATYVAPLDAEHKKSTVWPDGYIRPRYSPADTDTGRTKANDPPIQTFPKRNEEYKVVRKAVVAPQGKKILSIDYGQIEYRVIGMASRDKVIVDSLYNDYDVHMEWTQLIAKEQPRWLRRHNGDIKAARTELKNALVFPAFYGAMPPGIAVSLQLPLDYVKDLHARFRRKFSGVFKWHDKVISDYERFGYVQGLTGRRRHAPLSVNKIINTDIQATATEMACDAMVRLLRQSLRDKDPDLACRLFIHDDLTFIVDADKVDYYVERIVPVMLNTPFKFVNCPLTAEAEVGDDWYSLEKCGQGIYRSDKLPF